MVNHVVGKQYLFIGLYRSPGVGVGYYCEGYLSPLGCHNDEAPWPVAKKSIGLQ